MNDRMARAKTFRRRVTEKESKAITQNELCQRYLLIYNSITPLEALEAFGCFRLSAIIYDLRNDGWKIRTDINEGKKKFAIYVLEEQEGEE